MVPDTTMIRGVVSSSSTAAVNWARVETVVTVPPEPPVVPPFCDANPRVAASEIVARFSMLAWASRSTVGVGEVAAMASNDARAGNNLNMVKSAKGGTQTSLDFELQMHWTLLRVYINI